MGKGREIQRGQSGEMGGEEQWGQETQGEMERERDERQTGQRRGARKSPEAAQGGDSKGRDKEGRLEQLRPATPREDYAEGRCCVLTVNSIKPIKPIKPESPGLCALEADFGSHLSPGPSCVTLNRSLPLDEGSLSAQERRNHAASSVNLGPSASPWGGWVSDSGGGGILSDGVM